MRKPVLSPIVTSKLHTPRLPLRHLPRPRLIEQLNAGAAGTVLLVCAPAGSGKSTLLSEWAAAAPMPTGWISLDEGDNDLGIFLDYILAAVQRLFPDRSLPTRDLLRSVTLPPARTLAVSLSNDLDLIDADFMLILDDYHLITNPAVHEVLLLLLQHPPRGLHLAIATRTEPSWPLGTLRAYGEITELHFSDLRFTPEESAAYLRQALGDALADDFVAVLHDETEGWAAGLHLMTLIANQDGRQKRPIGDQGTISDIGAFLLDEVLAGQPPLVQERLTRLAIPGRFSASLCEAVNRDTMTADEDEGWGREFLAEIEQRNLFLIPLDHYNEFFRFHHLFRRFLLDRLRERKAPSEIAALHRHASLWFAERGLIEEAIDHALSANDTALAADLVARFRHDFYNKEQFARLTRLLRLLPIEAKEHQPEILLAEARVATMNWRFTEATVFLDHAEHELARGTLDSRRQDAAKGELATLRAILDLWSGNADQLFTGVQNALSLLPHEACHLRGLAHMGIAAAHWQSNDRCGAWGYLDAQLAETPTHVPVFATLLQTKAFFCWLDNDLTNLLVTARRLLSVSEELDLPDQRGIAHYFAGIVHYEQNDLDAARAALTNAVAARFNLRILWWAEAAGLLAWTEQALGQVDQAQQTLLDATDFLLERHAIRVLPNIGAFQADLDRRRGRLLEARVWGINLEPGPLTWSPAIFDPRLAQARAFLLQDEDAIEVEAAAALISQLQEFSTRVPNEHLFCETEALSVILDSVSGRTEEALDRAEQLVLRTFPEGWVRLFVDLGAPMERVLHQLAGRRSTAQAVSRILEAFPRSTGTMSSVQQPGLVEPLTDRELEVLLRLVARDSNKEIAAQLYIAPATVKRHTLSIYRKLEVNDRREAVARARELQLLPPE
jgi:LuxR family maltose regulon positive regulatory protein